MIKLARSIFTMCMASLLSSITCACVYSMSSGTSATIVQLQIYCSLPQTGASPAEGYLFSGGTVVSPALP